MSALHGPKVENFNTFLFTITHTEYIWFTHNGINNGNCVPKMFIIYLMSLKADPAAVGEEPALILNSLAHTSDQTSLDRISASLMPHIYEPDY